MILIEERQTVKVPGETSLFVSFRYNKAIVDEVKMLSNIFYNEITREWEIPLTGLSELLDRVCKIDEIQLKLMNHTQESQDNIVLEEYRTNPFEYQVEGIKYGLNHDSWLLLDAPGLGKTLQLIYLAQELKSRHDVQHCLVICGINTLKINWKKEIEKHSNLDCRILGQRITKKGKFVVDGVKERLEQLKNPIDEFFVITNIETLRDKRIVQQILKGSPNKFDMIILDEIHTCKSHQSQQGSNLMKLTSARFKVGATGTLLLNDPLDAYVPLSWIGAERATYTDFRYYYCVYGGQFGKDLVGYKNLDVMKQQLEHNSLRRTKDILNLPPKTVINEYIDMHPSQEDFYENIKSGIVDQVDKVVLKPSNVLAMVARLRQATALPSILTTENIRSAKIDRAVDLTQQLITNGEKVVIFSTFKAPVYELAQQLSQYNPVVSTGDIDDVTIANNIDRFQNDPETKVFLGTWSKCGTGITLTAANYMIFIDTPFTDGVYEQAQDRIHRIGSDRSVFIFNLIARNSIDERVLEIVNDKRALANYIVDDEITESGLLSLQKYIEQLKYS